VTLCVQCHRWLQKPTVEEVLMTMMPSQKLFSNEEGSL